MKLPVVSNWLARRARTTALARFAEDFLVKGIGTAPSAVAPSLNTGGPVWARIWESTAGAWQRNVEIDAPRDLLMFPALYSVVTGIAADVAKMGVDLVKETEDDVYESVVATSPYRAVLNRPNHYQTWYKFIEQWVLSKMLTGNTYVLRVPDGRGMTRAAYILNPLLVTPLVSQSGDVFYQLGRDPLSGLDDAVVAPRTEVGHDMCAGLWHPLVGVPPIYACALAATLGNKILTNSTKFFDNMSRPSGMISAPGTIPDETAKRLKTYWEENYTGGNIGRLAVMGDGLKYEPMTIPAQDAQLIEQANLSREDVATAYHYPLYKLGGTIPQGMTVEDLNLGYYTDCLQPIIESMEEVLSELLQLPAGYEAELDDDNLMRMNKKALIEAEAAAVKGVIKTPNEARRCLGYRKKPGGDSLYIQQQNYSLEAIQTRDEGPDPFKQSTTGATPPATSPTNPDAAAKELVDFVTRELLLGEENAV